MWHWWSSVITLVPGEKWLPLSLSWDHPIVLLFSTLEKLTCSVIRCSQLISLGFVSEVQENFYLFILHFSIKSEATFQHCLVMSGVGCCICFLNRPCNHFPQASWPSFWRERACRGDGCQSIRTNTSKMGVQTGRCRDTNQPLCKIWVPLSKHKWSNPLTYCLGMVRRQEDPCGHWLVWGEPRVGFQVILLALALSLCVYQ